MPITVTWLQEHRVIYERISGVITQNDLQSVKERFQPYFEAGVYPVHIVIDMLDLEQYPKNVRQIRDAMTNIHNKRAGWLVLVTHDAVVRFLSSVTTQVLVPNARLRVFENLQAAIEFLSESDTTLAPLQLPTEKTLNR